MKRLVLLVAILWMVEARAQTAEPQVAPLDELLSTPISTAAKYEQNMSEVAASVTVISAEEIARYGWRTLADVLAGVRGVYLTYDRGYTYLGVHGISRPGDNNNRFLVLLNGQALIETIAGVIDVGTGLAIDMSTVERIEFVRGPGSVMYGTGAMFGVINLITKDASESPSAEIATGSGGLWTGSARGGARWRDIQFGGAVSWREQNGRSLYFPEFDTGAGSDGVVSGRDSADYRSVIATASWRGARVMTLQSSHRKGLPTASWGSIFGADAWFSEGRSMWALDYSRPLAVGKQLSARGYYDHHAYEALLPYPGFEAREHGPSDRIGVEVRYDWDIRPNHRITTGIEQVRARSEYTVVGQSLRTAYDYTGAYLQAESQFTPRVAATVGFGFDKRSRVDAQYTPRVAVILRPTSKSVLKLLYGRAFRAPTVFELDFTSVAILPSVAEPESIRTAEIVLEQRIGDSVLVTGSLFDVHVEDLIGMQPVGDAFQFQNVASAKSRGAELRLDYRRNDGIWSYIGFTNQRAEENGEGMRNSPQQLVKAGISTATANRFYGALEARYESERKTKYDQKTDAVLLANLNAGWHMTRALTLTFNVRNALDTEYAVPAAAFHVQDTIPQDGRTFIMGIKASLK